MPERAALHLSITGLVQGVGFRWSLSREAAALGLSGWVRNRADGSVEACAAGHPESLEALRRWAEVGPPSARVSEVLASPADPQAVDAAAGFVQRPTV
jgi:acylphosphatase